MKYSSKIEVYKTKQLGFTLKLARYPKKKNVYRDVYNLQAPFRKFEVVTLHLNHFDPYYRGRRQVNSDPLNKENITSLELHVYGGVYLPVKQSGTASLEVDWIKAIWYLLLPQYKMWC